MQTGHARMPAPWGHPSQALKEMALDVGDLVFCRVHGDDGPICVTAWAVELADSDVICGTSEAGAAGIEHKVTAKAGETTIAFLRIPGEAVSCSKPSGWTGLRAGDIPSLGACRAAWKKAPTTQLLSSDAELEPNVSSKPAKKSARLAQDLKGLEKLMRAGASDDDEEEESEDDDGDVGILPPGQKTLVKSKTRKSLKKDGLDLQTLLAAGVSSGTEPKDLLTLYLLNQLIGQQNAKKKKKRSASSTELLGGSSSESSASDREASDGKGMKAVSSLHRLHEQILRKPRRVREIFEAARDCVGASLDHARLGEEAKLGSVQRTVPDSHDGCGSVRAVEGWQVRGGPGPADSKPQEQGAGCAGQWRLGDGMASNGPAGSTAEARLLRDQGRDGRYIGLCGGDGQAQEAGKGCPGSRRRRRRGGRRRGAQMTSPAKLHDWFSSNCCLRHPMLESRNSTKFSRYLIWFESVQGILLERSGDDVRLFPCALPCPEVLRIKTAVDETEARQVWAKQLLNTFIAWSNFVVLGCPDGACEPQAAYRSACEARSFADRLLGEAIEFASADLITGRLKCAGRRATVEALMEQVGSFAAAGYVDPVQASSSSTALPVTATRVAVPEKAGRVDPLQWLPDEQAEVVAGLESLRREPHLWEEICHACHRVPEGDEAELAQKLLATDMAVLVPEGELPRNQHGGLMQGGLFCVEKNATEDRLIFDRRPENATMPRLEWAALPSAACFTRMLLGPCQYLRASGDDLRNFYYMLRLPPNWVRFNSVGRRVATDVVAMHGLDPAVPHRLCFRVLGMGDRNGCAIAQATHEAILKSVGLLDPQETLAYGRTVPAGDLWQGVYFDDLLIASRQTLEYPMPLDGSFVPPPAQGDDADILLTKAAEGAYEKADLERALHKSF